MQIHPEFVRDGAAVFVEQIDRLHQFPVDIKLQLAVGGITDANRGRTAVPFQMVYGYLGQLMLPFDAVHDLQGVVFFELMTASRQSFHKTGGLIGKPDAQKAIKRRPHPGSTCKGNAACTGYYAIQITTMI
jgi:hypothetical protein